MDSKEKLNKVYNLFVNSYMMLIDDCIKPYYYMIKDLEKTKENEVLIKLEYYDPFKKRVTKIELQKGDLEVVEIFDDHIEIEYMNDFSVYFYNVNKVYLNS